MRWTTSGICRIDPPGALSQILGCVSDEARKIVKVSERKRTKIYFKGVFAV